MGGTPGTIDPTDEASALSSNVLGKICELLGNELEDMNLHCLIVEP
jgi:hypothetical protein